MKRILLASVAALGLAGTASAADLAVKAPVVYAPLFTWTGCYLGVNGGWIGGEDSWRTRPDGRFLDPTVFNQAQLNELYGIRYHDGGNDGAGTAGGQFGCQWQWGSWVIGGEWDFNWSGLTEDQYVAGPLNNFAPGSTRYEVWHHKQVDWFTTARTRLGWAWDRLLIYATGGIAMAAYDAYSQFNFIPGANNQGPEYWGGYREKRIGYAVGGGIEWAFANNWTAKAEFLWLDFGTFDYISPWLQGGAPNQNEFWRHTVDAQEYVVRVGINYLFHLGGAPVVAKY